MAHAFLRRPNQDDAELPVGEILTDREGWWYGRTFAPHYTEDLTEGPFESPERAVRKVEARAGVSLQQRQRV